MSVQPRPKHNSWHATKDETTHHGPKHQINRPQLLQVLLHLYENQRLHWLLRSLRLPQQSAEASNVLGKLAEWPRDVAQKNFDLCIAGIYHRAAKRVRSDIRCSSCGKKCGKLSKPGSSTKLQKRAQLATVEVVVSLALEWNSIAAKLNLVRKTWRTKVELPHV